MKKTELSLSTQNVNNIIRETCSLLIEFMAEYSIEEVIEACYHADLIDYNTAMRSVEKSRNRDE